MTSRSRRNHPTTAPIIPSEKKRLDRWGCFVRLARQAIAAVAVVGIAPSLVFAQSPAAVRVPSKPAFRLSPVAEDSTAIVRNPAKTVGTAPRGDASGYLPGSQRSVGAPSDANRIRVADNATRRPIEPARKAVAPVGNVAPVGFTVELLEPALESEEDASQKQAGDQPGDDVEYRAQVLPAAGFEEDFQEEAAQDDSGDASFQDDSFQDNSFQDDEAVPAPPPVRRTPGRNAVPPRARGNAPQDNDEDGLYGIDRAERQRDPQRPSRLTPDSNVKVCAEIYNDRDCCEEGEFCADQSRRVRSRALRTYSKDMLDITPRFQPDPNADENAEQYSERLARTLDKAESRDWKDRNGRVIATGKFTDMRNGRVVIESAQGTQELLYLSLSNNDQCFVNAWWDLPNECQLGDDIFQTRQWASSTFAWKASGLCHKPLYWEDINLERYGHTVGPVAQPIVSGAHFFGTIFVLPYKMGINPPGECQYALGYYRPGSCAPRYISPLPLSKRGAMLQATSVLGLIWLTP